MDERSQANLQSDNPHPVVVTPDPCATSPSAAPLSFTIPLHEPQNAPSWVELLGQR